MQHDYGKTEGHMGVLKIMSKGRDMDTWEQLYIHRLNGKRKKIFNEQHTSENDTHFKLALRDKYL